MEEKQDNYITLNGVRISPAMMKALKEWYSSGSNKDEHCPAIMIDSLHIVADCLIELSQEIFDKDKDIMRALRQLKFVEEELKPFLEGEVI